MDDHPLFPLLETYLDDLHAGRPPDRERLLAAHPELSGILACLDDLHRLTDPTDVLPAAGGTGQPTLDYPEHVCPASDPGPSAADFEQFEILAELGRGGMGVVFKAWQKDLDRLVAIKMILAGQFCSPEQVRRFAVEARAAARLQHPNIVRLITAGAVHGQQYLVMEYIEGRGLDEVLRQGSVPAAEAARLLRDIAAAVEHLHEHGIVHRDLKPSNILIDAAGRPFVTDFGLAKLREAEGHQTTTGAIVGTPSYMAPEQAAGRHADVGPRSDIYSLGAILYEMLTGRPPFAADSPLDTLVLVLESEPARPSQLNLWVPGELEAVCLKCLEKDPADRYPSAAALAQDLERYLAGEEVQARRPGAWQRLRSWTRREPSLVTHLAALAVFALVVQVNQLVLGVDSVLHTQVMLGLAFWAAASWFFQACLRVEVRAGPARFAWAATDVLLLTALLFMTNNQGSPLVVGYPLLIVCAGLWFRIRLVWFTTAVAAVGYVILVQVPLQAPPVAWMPHHHVLFLVALVVVGAAVAYQVKRVRVLSRYYDKRPLP